MTLKKREQHKKINLLCIQDHTAVDTKFIIIDQNNFKRKLKIFFPIMITSINKIVTRINTKVNIRKFWGLNA
jgi:hypothetical protein